MANSQEEVVSISRWEPATWTRGLQTPEVPIEQRSVYLRGHDHQHVATSCGRQVVYGVNLLYIESEVGQVFDETSNYATI